MVPKCCETNETFNEDYVCAPTNITVNYEHYYFHSNGTHINTDAVKFTPTFYKKSLTCGRGYYSSDLNATMVLGFISNSSFIENEESLSSTSIFPPSQYCVDQDSGRISLNVCFEAEGVVAVYIPFLILSTLCYFLSASIYWFLLKAKNVHNKCFIGYALSMGVTFTILIILQTTNPKGGCNAVGSLFIFSSLSSFVWLACLCFELVVMLRNFKEEKYENRLLFYIAVTLVFPCFFLFLTLVPHGIPSVPNAFLKADGRIGCVFEEYCSLHFFIAVGILMVSSLCFLGCNFYLMRRIGNKYKNDFNWLENRSKLIHVSFSCSLIWLTSAIWIFDTATRNDNDINIGNVQVYDVIEALQGIFTVAIFVMNRYTRPEIYAELCAGSETNSQRRPRLGTMRWLARHLSSRSGPSAENSAEKRANSDSQQEDDEKVE